MNITTDNYDFSKENANKDKREIRAGVQWEESIFTLFISYYKINKKEIQIVPLSYSL